MTNAVYFTAGIAALGGLCFLWDVALKGLFLDILRERIFSLRFELFEMGVSGELGFDTDTYRSMEILLSGVLRYAYRFTLFTYLFSMREQNRARKEKQFEDVAQQLSLKIARATPATQKKLHQMLEELHNALILYMAFTSLAFMASGLIYAILQALNFVKASKREITAVFEQEAYRTESRQPSMALA